MMSRGEYAHNSCKCSISHYDVKHLERVRGPARVVTGLHKGITAHINAISSTIANYHKISYQPRNDMNKLLLSEHEIRVKGMSLLSLLWGQSGT